MQKNKFSLLPYLFRHKIHYILGIIVLLLVDLCNTYGPVFIGEIIDILSDTSSYTYDIHQGILKLFLLGLVIMAGRFGWRYFIIGASRSIEYEIRNDLFKHLESLSVVYYKKHKTGDLMAHFTNDLTAIRNAFGMAVITVFDAVVMTLMVLFQMIFYVDLKLTLLSFIPLIFIAFGCYYYGKESKKRQLKKQNAFSELSDKVQESFAGIRVIKGFVEEDKDLELFTNISTSCMEKNLSVARLRAVFGPALDTIIGISIIITLAFGGREVLSGAISIGKFVAFNSYIGMLVWPMIACGDCINVFTQAAAAFFRISKIFEIEPEITDGENSCSDITCLKGDIKFNNLSFTYPDGNEKVLSDINLHIKAGEFLGILGNTGGGKSSLADLILRVYNTPSGMITIDDTNIDEIPLAILHRDIAYVPQENFLFSDTIEENIAFGLDACPSQKEELKEFIYEASKAACIHENICQFPDKYETLVGEMGVTLSGGQKQRSSLARALLKDAPILILDDSLSAVDTQTEERILNNLFSLRAGKTTIIIANRILALERCDNIAVLYDGELSEYGPHQKLVANNGFYAHIYEKQKLEDEIARQDKEGN